MLKADIEMVARPPVDDEGNILRQDRLLDAAERTARIASRIASVAQPNSALSADLNRELAQLYLASDSLAAAMGPVIGVAGTLPKTMEDFYMSLGPSLHEAELSCGSIVSMIERLEKHLG